MSSPSSPARPHRAAARARSAKIRCAWAQGEAMARYHDEEWGVPVRDDAALFELLTLEGAQAGLSWSTVLAKRDAYRKAFADFDPETVSLYTDADVRRLLGDDGIIRHQGKIEATVTNARAVLELRRQGTRFADFIWGFVEGRAVINAWKGKPPAETNASRAMSKALRARGFRFVGPTICYAFMQAAGLVNDHTVRCFRWKELGTRRKS